MQTESTPAPTVNGLIDLSFEIESNCDDLIDDVAIAIKDSTSEISTENAIATKTKRNNFKWTNYGEWNDLDAVLDFLEDEGFVVYDEKMLLIGQKFYFRCKRTPKAMKPYCAIRYILFLPSDSNEIILQCNDQAHNHTELLAGKKQQMSDEMIEFLTQLFCKDIFGFSALIKFIDEAREEKSAFVGEPNPNYRQIEYRLKKFRNKEIAPLFNLGDLSEWCGINSEFPSNEDQAFVIAHECSPVSGNEMHFRFCLSTPVMLRKFIGLNQICIDATYKLNWNNFPLIIVGTVDRMNKFHPLVYACTSNERTEDYEFVFTSIKIAVQSFYGETFEPTTLITDGAIPIRNAFDLVYISADLGIMCFPHVLRNVMKQPFIVKTNKPLIISDIKKVQQASNRAMFDMMCKLLCAKWDSLEPIFIAYFKKQWMDKLSNWFEGSANYTPSSNNGVESHNASIKRKITLRKRLPLNQFLVAIKQLTETCSKQFSTGIRQIATEPNIIREMMVNAAFMCQSQFKCFKVKCSNENTIVFVVPSQTNCEEINANEKHYRSLVNRQWKSFDEFITHGFQKFYIVKVSVSAWKNESTCTCVCFFKKNICKHVIAIAMREKLIAIPNTANPTLLNQNKRKQGRTNNAKKALEHQN